MSLELNEGRPVLLLDYGSGVLRLETPTSLADGKDHLISLSWAPNVSFSNFRLREAEMGGGLI